MPVTTLERPPVELDTQKKLALLTNGERRVLEALLKTGLDNADLADHLGIKLMTVQNHLTKVRRKLKLKRTVDLFKMFPEFAPPSPLEPTVIAVTQKEKAIVDLIELTNPEIAKKLKISKRTVDTHIEHLLDKCCVRNKRESAYKRSHFVFEIGRKPRTTPV